MKLKSSSFSILAVAIVAICTICFLGSVPQAKSMGYNRVRHCSPWQCSGDKWNLAPRGHNIFDNFNDLFFFARSNIQRELSQSIQSRIQYETREDDSRMELVIDVPGLHASDINIHLEKDGKLLTISGSRSNRHQGKDRKITFEQMFSVDPKVVDTDKLKADMADGVLVISAPKFEEQEVKDKRRVVPINTQGNGSRRHEDTSVLISHEEKKEEAAAIEESSTDDLEITEEDI